MQKREQASEKARAVMKLKWKKDAKNTYILINMTAGFKKRPVT